MLLPEKAIQALCQACLQGMVLDQSMVLDKKNVHGSTPTPIQPYRWLRPGSKLGQKRSRAAFDVFERNNS